MSKRWSEENVSNAVENNESVASVLRDLGVKPVGGNYRTFHKYVKQYGLDTNHFTGQSHLKNQTHNWNAQYELDEILVKDSSYTSTNRLKKRLIKAGKLDYECEWCGISEWRDNKISLHLDHINGVNDDHRLENLRLLCPNCHSQTSTYKGRNKGSYIDTTTEKRHKHTLNHCSDCQSIISRSATRCKSCAAKQFNDTKIDWPSCEKLIEMVEKTNYSAVSRNLGVSDNAVRKRLRNHYDGDLP